MKPIRTYFVVIVNLRGWIGGTIQTKWGVFMTLDEIKKKLIVEIEKNKDDIIAIGEKIAENPEAGYCEENTSKLAREQLDKLGIEYEYPLAVTGIKGKLSGRQDKVNICVIGELDAVRCAGVPSHKCGHHIQIAVMLGVAMVFSKSGIMSWLDGNITLLAAPAEEFIDLEYRRHLKERGAVKYYGGKQQLIAEGAFDDVDMAMLVHAQPDEPQAKMYVRGYNLGFAAETITFKGKAVHGSTPFDGINALNAAALAILGVHANRETFREEDRIRIHPIITKGGDVVNSVPDEVCIDTYVRGASTEAIQKGNAAVHRACTGAAEMIGANVEFEYIPGYLPLKEDANLSEVFEDACSEIIGEDNIVYGKEVTGSSDIGDLSHILPTIQPSVGGFKGMLHSKEFEVVNTDVAYLLPVKAMAVTIAELLYNNAEKAVKIKDSFKPVMTKYEYIKYLENKGV